MEQQARRTEFLHNVSTSVQSGLPQAGGGAEEGKGKGKKSYVIGTVVIFASVYSQYLGIRFDPILRMLIVYGVPILVVTLLWGTTIIKRFFNRTLSALKFGLGFFGAFTVLGIVVSAVILLLLVLLDPDVVDLLARPNPVLDISPESAWIMIGVSILVVGPAEEYIFTGFMFGGLLDIFGKRHWLGLALVSSLLFGVVHLYYALVYGIASLVQFADLVTFGMAMASTYYLSGGNLFVPSLIHGVYDATGFIGVANSRGTGILLRVALILVGVVVGVVLLVERAWEKRQRPPPSRANENLGTTVISSVLH